MLPLKAAIIPLFMIIKKLGLMDNFLSVILIFTAMGIPSTIFILSGFLKAIPMDLEYAARIDGCNDFGIYAKIMMPVIAPGIALVTIYNAVPIWNDFFFPLVFLHSRKLKTLPVGLSTFADPAPQLVVDHRVRIKPVRLLRRKRQRLNRRVRLRDINIRPPFFRNVR